MLIMDDKGRESFITCLHGATCCHVDLDEDVSEIINGVSAEKVSRPKENNGVYPGT